MKRKEIYTYEAPWDVYSMSWCRSPEGRFKMAIGSYIEAYENSIKLIRLEQNDEGGVFHSLLEFDHLYPATKILFAPPNQPLGSKEYIATTGDYLRLWTVDDNRVECATLNNNKHTGYCAPLTSFDWNESDPSMIGVCSIDTTCTIWDLVKLQPRTQLIAHDKEVYDISFTSNPHLFSTVGADGSLRMFDLRSLECSSVLYETHENPSSEPQGLMKLAWNKLESNFIATIMTESSKIVILDIRMRSAAPYAELNGHQSFVNSIAWAPHSPSYICSAGDDKQALIWDISTQSPVIEDPVLAYEADAEINHMEWCISHEDYIAISYNNKVQLLKV